MSGSIGQDPFYDRSLVEDRIRLENDSLADLDKSEDVPAPLITPQFIRDCLGNNERGDGVLYATLHRGKYVCNLKERDATKDRGVWYVFNGVHWELDKRYLAHNAVEEVAVLYDQEAQKLVPALEEAYNNLTEANLRVSQANKKAKVAERNKIAALKSENKELELSSEILKAEADAEGLAAEAEVLSLKGAYAKLKAEKKELESRVDRLRSASGIERTLTHAHRIGPRDSLAVIGHEFDQKPWLLPCLNGVIDLQTGMLYKGKPQDYLLRAVPFEYNYAPDFLKNGNKSPCPTWDHFFGEIHQEDPEVISFVQRILGYGITGLTTEHWFPVFIGAGRNGKGTMFEVIKQILGELAWAIQPEMLLEQKNSRSSVGPSADLVSLYGRRFVIASETDEGRKISTAMVKRLTGGDSLTVRAPFDKYEWGYTPTHSIYLYTNDPPWGLTKDFAMRQRLAMIEYPLRYVDAPDQERKDDPARANLYRLKDKGLMEKLRKEYPGILQALVRWCLLWQRDGLQLPDKLRDTLHERVREEDTLGQFFDECINRTDDNDHWVTFKQLYGHFLKWWEEYNGGGRAKPHSKKAFGHYLKEVLCLSCDSSNGRRYFGLRIKDEYAFSE
ncbi:hypothetical protein GMLC_41850 [Geomonas limicola]|uniref:SF3 helicase domain-containing protein n=2 Tax=Geomonas TaxID=2651583 RepID=A0A6V8MPM4_9BACT|nr:MULTISPECIES: phage/plasmid primase, P4 family [Geomonas]GFO62006.1 hypothetical protein GMST_43310 [Geomonas silvestris]GFO70606.1 hypothetical protein GMLC_41850 [Geomonas limicola]